MKTTFINTITEIMQQHEEAMIVTADMGFSVFEALQKKYPTRFINTGVTEQASVGVASGLALSGHKVFLYAQASFVTMRCFEQLHLDAAYNHLNVKVVGVNAGFSLNQLGVSHFAVEDIAIMRTLPGVSVFSPGNAYEMEWAMRQSFTIEGPTYLRFTKLIDREDNKTHPTITLSSPVPVVKGTDAIIFATGGIIGMAREAVELLKEQRIHVGIYSVPTIKPLNVEKFLAIARTTEHVFTLEEHSVIGGLGTAIAEIFAETPNRPFLTRLGIPDTFTGVTGSMEYLLGINGLDPLKIASAIRKKIKN